MASKTSDLIFRFIGKDETGAAAKSAASNLDHIGSKASGLGKTLAGLGAAVSVGIIASKVTDFAKASVQSFETVGGESMKLQRIMGGNVEQMSALRGAAAMTGVSADTLATSMRAFSQDIEGNSKQLQGLGIATRDAAGNIRPTGDVLKDVAAVFKDMPNGAEKSTLAVQLFGRSGLDMIPMLNKGADGIADLEAKTAAYGLTLTKTDQDALAKFRASQRDLSLATEGVKTSFGKSLFPVLTEANTALVGLLPPLQQALTPALQSMGDVAVLAIRKLTENMPAVQERAKALADDIRNIAGGVERNWPKIVETVDNLGGALERVGRFTSAVWDAFRSLPPEVQQVIAMLALAQKTGVINVAFSAAGLVKDLVSKVSGMSVQAGIVNLNGATTGGVPAVTGATGAGASLGMLGTATIVAAGIGAVVGPANVGTRKNYDAAGLDNTRGA
nr:phage tail tape measure protein [Microthrixaceae bacterium]